MVSVPHGPARRPLRLVVLAVLGSLLLLAVTSGALAAADPTGGGGQSAAPPDRVADAHGTAARPAAELAADPANATGEGVTVAILDSGIDDGHPDLAGRVTERVDLIGAEPTHPENGTDESGHGTFVPGVLGGSGAASTTSRWPSTARSAPNAAATTPPSTSGACRSATPIRCRCGSTAKTRRAGSRRGRGPR
jgi:hypothetical protein